MLSGADVVALEFQRGIADFLIRHVVRLHGVSYVMPDIRFPPDAHLHSLSPKIPLSDAWSCRCLREDLSGMHHSRRVALALASDREADSWQALTVYQSTHEINQRCSQIPASGDAAYVFDALSEFGMTLSLL